MKLGDAKDAASKGKGRLSWIAALFAVLVLALASVWLGVPVRWSDPQSRSRQAKIEQAMIYQALSDFILDYGRFPTEAEGLLRLLTKKEGKGPYLENTNPLTDPWGNPIRYSVLSQWEVKFCSNGPDAKPATPDDICDSQFVGPRREWLKKQK